MAITDHRNPSAVLNELARDLICQDASVDVVAHELSELANELADLGVFTTEDRFPTLAQSIALSRFLSQVMRDDQYQKNPEYAHARVSRGGAALPDNYLYVQLGDDYVGGIDPEGRVST